MLTYTDGSLAAVLQLEGSGPPTMLYYRHITRLFEDAGHDQPVAYFGQLAIEATRLEDPEVKDLWTKVFLAHISLQAFEEAYIVLSDLPHLDL
jgi:nuclear pore complex protein Nup160